MNTIFFLIIVPASIVLSYLLTFGAVHKNEIIECKKWLEHSYQFPEFYLTQWQKDQCESYDIRIDSQIK